MFSHLLRPPTVVSLRAGGCEGVALGVAAVLGAVEGAALGVPDGAAPGVPYGAALGVPDGAVLGAVEGAVLGAVEGAVLGVSEGAALGVLVDCASAPPATAISVIRLKSLRLIVPPMELASLRGQDRCRADGDVAAIA